MTTADAVEHVTKAWDAGITVGVNPPGLLRMAVQLADARQPKECLVAAVYAAEAVRQLLKEAGHVDSPVGDLAVRAAALSEELQQYAVQYLTDK